MPQRLLASAMMRRLAFSRRRFFWNPEACKPSDGLADLHQSDTLDDASTFTHPRKSGTVNTQKAPRGDERGAEKAEGQAKRIQRIAGITDADPPAVPTAASEMPWDRTGMPATASAAVQPRLKPAPATRDGEPPKGTRERNPSKENGSEEKDGNGDPRLHDCLPAKWMNHVLVHETSTVKEVLAVVWAQGHCKSFVEINLATTFFRLGTIVCGAKSPREQIQISKEVLEHHAFKYALELVEQNVEQLSTRSVSSVLWALARLKYTPKDHSLVTKMAQALLNHNQPPSERELSTCLWAISTLAPDINDQIISAYEERILEIVEGALTSTSQKQQGNDTNSAITPSVRLSPVSVCTISTAFAKMESHKLGDRFAKALAEAMAISIEKCDEQGVVSLVWAASKLCLPVDDNLFWGKVSKIVAELPLELITQEMTALLSIFQNLGSDHVVVDKLMELVGASAMNTTGQDVSLGLLAVHMAGKGDKGLELRLWKTLLSSFELGEAKLSSLSIALHLLQRNNPLQSDGSTDFQTLETVWAAMTKMVKTGEMGGKNLVNSLYLLSKNKLVPNQKLLHAISKSISKDIHTLLPWELSLSLWSLATLRYYDPGLINAVTRVWQSLLEGLQADEGMTTNQKLLRACPQLLISFAVFGHKSDAADLLAKAVIRDIRKELQVPGVPNLGECQQVLANTVWSLALLEMLDKPYVVELTALCEEILGADAVAHRGGQGEVLPLARGQLYQAQLAASLQPRHHLQFSPELERLNRQHWQEQNIKSSYSAYQDEVFRELLKIVPDAELEALSGDGAFSLDIGFRDAHGQNVAVEVDGPSHFMSSSPHLPLRSFVLRNDLLRCRGYIVVNTPLYEWRKAENKEMYLRRILRQGGVVLS